MAWRKDQSFYALIEYRMETDIGPGTTRDIVEIRAPSLEKAAEKASRLRPVVTPKGTETIHGGTALLVGVYTAAQLEEKLSQD